MNQKTKTQPSPPVPLVVDTCVIVNCLSDNMELAQETRAFLLKLHEKNYALSYNQISFYECVKTVMPQRRDRFIEFIDGVFQAYTIDVQGLMVAAELHNVYGHYSRNGGKGVVSASASTEDILIASTALLAGGHILTQNVKDFPMPFFDPVHKEFIQYQEKTVPKFAVNYILMPDISFIQDAADECFQNKKPIIPASKPAQTGVK